MRRARGKWNNQTIRKVASQIVDHSIEEQYTEFKRQYLTAHGDMIEAFLRKAEVLANMRQINPAFIARIHREMGESLDYLNSMADAFVVFARDLPRRDLAPMYFLNAAEAAVAVQDAYRQEGEPIELAIVANAAREMIANVNVETVGPRAVATSLAHLFGLISPGDQLFNGFHSLATASQPTIDSVAANLHEVARPLFFGWLEKERARMLEAQAKRMELSTTGLAPTKPVETPQELPVLTVSLVLKEKPADVSALVSQLVAALSEQGIEVVEVRRKQLSYAAQPFTPRLVKPKE